MVLWEEVDGLLPVDKALRYELLEGLPFDSVGFATNAWLAASDSFISNDGKEYERGSIDAAW